MPDVSNIQIAGKGFSKRPIPKWLKLIQILWGIGIFLVIICGALAWNDWNWLLEGFSTKNSLMAATAITIGLGLGFWLPRQPFLDSLWGLRQENKIKVYSGYTNALLPWVTALLVATPFIATFLLLKMSFAKAPLPLELAQIHQEFPSPTPEENLIPIYFWDYATWFNPDWLDVIEVVLPYEKGPPEKFLSKVFFQSSETHQTELELDGKRPRTYTKNQVVQLFQKTNPDFSSLPLIYRLEKEGGLGQPSQRLSKLYLMTWGADETQAIGVPWSDENPQNSGHLFLWGPDGSVFQVQCFFPCHMSRLLELIFFPKDPKGSVASRHQWTVEKLKSLVAQKPDRHYEKVLSLYLVSLLTLDPRDPEAFFHIGKLTQNKQTVLSAIQYGRDLGLEPAKIAELESRLNQLKF